jgi:hypothetical protein
MKAPPPPTQHSRKIEKDKNQISASFAEAEEREAGTNYFLSSEFYLFILPSWSKSYNSIILVHFCSKGDQNKVFFFAFPIKKYN